MTREELLALAPDDVATYRGTHRYHIRRNPDATTDSRYQWQIRQPSETEWSVMREPMLLDDRYWTVDKPLDRITVSMCGTCQGRFVQQPGEQRKGTCISCAAVVV